jgi:hypothetical protein
MTSTMNAVGVVLAKIRLPSDRPIRLRVNPPLNKAALSQPPAEIEQQFRVLAKLWKAETEHLSSAARMAKHPAYRAIIQMGRAVVPLLLAQLKRDPDFWFAALREITGENPVPARSAGKLKEMARAWLDWGQAKGYIR